MFNLATLTDVQAIQAKLDATESSISSTNALTSDAIAQLRAAIAELRADLPQMIALAVDAKIKTVADERQEKLNGDVPYFEVISEIDVNAGGKTKFELDWNPAFIKELQANGYVGATEQDYIHQWLKVITDNVERGLTE